MWPMCQPVLGWGRRSRPVPIRDRTRSSRFSVVEAERVSYRKNTRKLAHAGRRMQMEICEQNIPLCFAKMSSARSVPRRWRRLATGLAMPARHRASSHDVRPVPEPPWRTPFRFPHPGRPRTREPRPAPAVGQPAAHLGPPAPTLERPRVLARPFPAVDGHRPRRTSSAPHLEILLLLLPPVANASVAEQGRAGAATNPPAQHGQGRGAA